ncbi:hypothetical protein MGALJ_11730 [Mycobacterium gallinarum]|uniref:Uncharacterized protein n=1 Tax=Mycobacterium gallinarum TaxID=39689 RepID=A0A9W4AZS6_9MYCO|nr:hypothetical protein MGALJ_11730 [Mycobacterium gallinarum]
MGGRFTTAAAATWASVTLYSVCVVAVSADAGTSAPLSAPALKRRAAANTTHDNGDSGGASGPVPSRVVANAPVNEVETTGTATISSRAGVEVIGAETKPEFPLVAEEICTVAVDGSATDADWVGVVLGVELDCVPRVGESAVFTDSDAAGFDNVAILDEFFGLLYREP